MKKCFTILYFAHKQYDKKAVPCANKETPFHGGRANYETRRDVNCNLSLVFRREDFSEEQKTFINYFEKADPAYAEGVKKALR